MSSAALLSSVARVPTSCSPPLRPAYGLQHTHAWPLGPPPQAPSPSFRVDPKPVGRWAKPLLALGYHTFNGILRLRGYHHRTVQTPVGRMHALVSSSRKKTPPLLVLTGLGSRASDYLRLLWRLKPSFQKVVALDMPGHGRSKMAVPINHHSFLTALLDTKQQLTPGRILLLGHSMGGQAALQIAAWCPQDIVRLSVVAPAGGPVNRAMWKHYYQMFWLRNYADARAIVDAIFPRRYLPHSISPAFIGQRLGAPPLRELLRSDVLTTHVPPNDLAHLPPTFFVWPGREALLPPEHKSYFLRYLPRSAQVWEPQDMSHGALALGSKKYVDPIMAYLRGQHAPTWTTPARPELALHARGCCAGLGPATVS